MKDIVLIRGGGDLASGVALRLHRSGLRVVITELDQPLVIRRLVSFAEAIYQGETHVEGVTARRVDGISDIHRAWEERVIPVLVDRECRIIYELDTERPPWLISVLVDARMTKRPPDLGMDSAPLVVGLGPGFIAGENCHAVIGFLKVLVVNTRIEYCVHQLMDYSSLNGKSATGSIQGTKLLKLMVNRFTPRLRVYCVEFYIRVCLSSKGLKLAISTIEMTLATAVLYPINLWQLLGEF
jgi:hypothetical protein